MEELKSNKNEAHGKGYTIARTTTNNLKKSN